MSEHLDLARQAQAVEEQAPASTAPARGGRR
jgi:hypothetical protein